MQTVAIKISLPKNKFIIRCRSHYTVKHKGWSSSPVIYQQKGQLQFPSWQRPYTERSAGKTYTKGSRDKGKRQERSTQHRTCADASPTGRSKKALPVLGLSDRCTASQPCSSALAIVCSERGLAEAIALKTNCSPTTTPHLIKKKKKEHPQFPYLLLQNTSRGLQQSIAST